MGMKNSSAIFQRAMESILSGLKGVILHVYLDDVIVFAENEDSLNKRLNAVKAKLRDKWVTVNGEKSVALSDKISFLGFCISADGIRSDIRLVDKILDECTPISKRDVQHLLA